MEREIIDCGLASVRTLARESYIYLVALVFIFEAKSLDAVMYEGTRQDSQFTTGGQL